MPSQVYKSSGTVRCASENLPYLKRKAIAFTFRYRFLYKLFIHYKGLIIHARAKVIDEVAEILDAELTPEAKSRILHNSSIADVQKKIASSVGRNGKNHDNQLMINHIADGKIGKWKEWLSEDEINFLTKYCQEYLQFFGYESK